MKACFCKETSFELPLGEIDEFSMTPKMVAKKKRACREGMEILKHATDERDQRPVSSLTSVAQKLRGCTIADRAQHDFEAEIEISRGDWN